MPLNIHAINQEGLMMKFEGKTIFIGGSIDCIEPGVFMHPFFEEVHQFILNNKMTEIEINIKELSFLNSSGIKEFVELIMKQEILSETQRYKIKFICNPEYPWQEMSTQTLSLLIPDTVIVEI